MRPAVRPCTAHAGGWQAATARAAAAPSRLRRSTAAVLLVVAGSALPRGAAAAAVGGAARCRRWARAAVAGQGVAQVTVRIAVRFATGLAGRLSGWLKSCGSAVHRGASADHGRPADDDCSLSGGHCTGCGLLTRALAAQHPQQGQCSQASLRHKPCISSKNAFESERQPPPVAALFWPVIPQLAHAQREVPKRGGLCSAAQQAVDSPRRSTTRGRSAYLQGAPRKALWLYALPRGLPQSTQRPGPQAA